MLSDGSVWREKIWWCNGVDKAHINHVEEIMQGSRYNGALMSCCIRTWVSLQVYKVQEIRDSREIRGPGGQTD